jgi:hypothetical protein
MMSSATGFLLMLRSLIMEVSMFHTMLTGRLWDIRQDDDYEICWEDGSLCGLQGISTYTNILVADLFVHLAREYNISKIRLVEPFHHTGFCALQNKRYDQFTLEAATLYHVIAGA